MLIAIEAAGYRPTGHCTPLTCLENRVYDLRLEDGRHIVAQFYRPGRWTREAIAEEHEFLSELRAAGIPVCAPLAFVITSYSIHYTKLYDGGEAAEGQEHERTGEEIQDRPQ